MYRRPTFFRSASNRGSGTGGVFIEHTNESDRSDNESQHESERDPNEEDQQHEPEGGPNAEDPQQEYEGTPYADAPQGQSEGAPYAETSQHMSDSGPTAQGSQPAPLVSPFGDPSHQLGRPPAPAPVPYQYIVRPPAPAGPAGPTGPTGPTSTGPASVPPTGNTSHQPGRPPAPAPAQYQYPERPSGPARPAGQTGQAGPAKLEAGGDNPQGNRRNTTGRWSGRPPFFGYGSSRGSGTGGVFAEEANESDSSDNNSSQHESEGGTGEGSQPVSVAPPSSHQPGQPLVTTYNDPGKPAGPAKLESGEGYEQNNRRRRKPIPLWAKWCACISIIIAIILAIVLGLVLGLRNRGSPSSLLDPNQSTSSVPPVVSVTAASSLAVSSPSASATAAVSASASDAAITAEPSAEASASDVPATAALSAGASASDTPATAIPSPGASASDALATAAPSVGASASAFPATIGSSAGASPSDAAASAGLPTPTGTDSGDQPSSQTIAYATSGPSPTFAGPLTGSPSNDPFRPSSPQPTVMRPDRPRLIAPAYRWSQLPTLIGSDSYLQTWDSTIMSSANQFAQLSPVSPSANETGPYDVPGQVKMRIKAFAYAYRMTSSETWLSRTWQEILNILTYAPVPSNPLSSPYPYQLPYFIDWYELTSALAIAYDWLFEFWSAEQRRQIEAMIIWAGLSSAIHDFGLDLSTPAAWTTTPGQENCASNAGVLMGLLAIWDALPSNWAANGIPDSAQQVFTQSLNSATSYCANSVSNDGTWIETPSAGLAGTTAQAELAASFLVATGSTYGLLTANPNFERFGLFQMYASGNKGLFDYGDAETTTYSVSGNPMMFYATQYNNPAYMLFQRDRSDAADPWSMFWYEPTVAGQFWSGLPLDHYFDDPQDSWVSMRSSWTDDHGLFVAMKSGKLTGHSAKGDLDLGDFVIDALGERWAVELGSGMTNATGYSDSEAQDSLRWMYYRKRTEGQNTILIGGENQNVGASSTCNFGSTNTVQDATTGFNVPADSTAFFTTDISTAYGEGCSVKRGIRLLNGRRQILLQDDISCNRGPIEWRMHTRAAVQVNGVSASLTLNGQTMEIRIINPTDGACFKTGDAVRQPSDPSLPPGTVDQPNQGVTVLSITLPAGSYNLQVLFNPRWPDMAADRYVTPPFVPIDGWTLTSHG